MFLRLFTLFVRSPSLSFSRDWSGRIRGVVASTNDRLQIAWPLSRGVVYTRGEETCEIKAAGRPVGRSFSFFLSRILPASADGQLCLDSCLRTRATARSYGCTLIVSAFSSVRSSLFAAPRAETRLFYTHVPCSIKSRKL